MIVWSGLGFVVVLILGLAFFGTEKIAESLTSDPRFYQEHQWLLLVAMVAAALLTYGFYCLLDRRARSGAGSAANRHTLFFIPVKWWPPIFVVMGVATLFSGNR